MRTASSVEVYGGSHITAYGNSSPEYSTGRLVAQQLGAIEYPFAQNGLVLAAEGNGYARQVRPASVRRRRTTAGAYGWPAATDLAIVNCGLADLAANGKVGNVLYPGAFKTALRALVAFIRLSAIFQADPSGASDASITYGGTWSDVPATDRNTGTGVRLCATNNSTLTIAVPATFPGNEIDLFWAATSGLGATITSVVTGATNTSTRDVVDATWADQVSSKANYAVTRITGLNPGAHTITVTLTGLGLISFDGWGIRALNPPNVVLCSNLKATQAALDAFLASAAADTPTASSIDTLNGWIASVANEFDYCYYHAQPDVIMENQSQGTSDAMHPNDYGHRLLASALLDKIATLPPRPPTPAPQPVAATSAELSANWTSTGGSYAPVAWTMLRDRQLRLSGRIARTGTPSPPETLLTLPDRHRPAKTVTYACPASTGTSALVDVASDGTVTYRAGSVGASGTIDLDPIRFTVDAAS